MCISELNKNKIPLKRDASGPDGIFRYQWVGLKLVHCLVSMLEELKPVVCTSVVKGGSL